MNKTNFKEDYPGLYTISGFLKFLGYIVIIFSIIGVVGGVSLVSDGDYRAVALIVFSIYSGLFTSVLLFGLSELIKLLVKIEFNTRKDDYYFKKGNSEDSTSAQNNRQSFEEWKKNNPSKTIGDYYSQK